MSVAREQGIASFGFAACLGAIGVAQGAQHFLGLVPCAFCLIERKPYYAGMLLAALALALPRRAARTVLWGLAVVLLAGAAISFVHVGVEQHWWPDPLPQCTSVDFSGMTMSQRLAAMPARPSKSCADPDYLVPFIPVSFTQMACLYALAVSAGLAMWLTQTRGRKFR